MKSIITLTASLLLTTQSYCSDLLAEKEQKERQALYKKEVEQPTDEFYGNIPILDSSASSRRQSIDNNVVSELEVPPNERVRLTQEETVYTYPSSQVRNASAHGVSYRLSKANLMESKIGSSSSSLSEGDSIIEEEWKRPS